MSWASAAGAGAGGPFWRGGAFGGHRSGSRPVRHRGTARSAASPSASGGGTGGAGAGAGGGGTSRAWPLFVVVGVAAGAVVGRAGHSFPRQLTRDLSFFVA